MADGEPAGADLIIGVAGSFTAQPLAPPLTAALHGAGYTAPEIRFADYNQIHQVCLAPAATLGDDLDVLVVLWRIEDVFERDLLDFLAGDDGARSKLLGGAGELAQLVARLASAGTPQVVVSTPPHPGRWSVDLLDAATSVRVGGLHRDVVSQWLDALATVPAIDIVDLDAAQRYCGDAEIVDAPKWALYRQPYRSRFWTVLGGLVGQTAARRLNPPPKCIVLDCDNTLWGGVVGEDGLGGLALDDAFPGRMFRDFQHSLKILASRGVMLAIASKNEMSDVIDVFEHHEGMVLGVDNIVAWRVNWQPKSENITSIAGELNIATDSLVFVDDDPTHVEEIRALLPDVRCLLVPEDLAELPSLLIDSGLFRQMRVSSEDRRRTDMMRVESARRAHAEAMGAAEFLASLELRVAVSPVGDDLVARVAQLTQKTNQFNLTTIRRTEGDVRHLLDSGEFELFALRVSDRFGDYGIVGFAVAETGEDCWSVDTFLLSCRVLGRGVESAFLAAVAGAAWGRGATRLVGRYVPTRKNGQVADFYPRHGFVRIADATGSFELDLRMHRPQTPVHIEQAR